MCKTIQAIILLLVLFIFLLTEPVYRYQILQSSLRLFID